MRISIVLATGAALAMASAGADASHSRSAGTVLSNSYYYDPGNTGAYGRPDPLMQQRYQHMQRPEQSVLPEYRRMDSDYAAYEGGMSTRQRLPFTGVHPAGSIVVSTSQRRLYYVLGDGTAMVYGVGVGRDGFTWGGKVTITRKAKWPSWTPPAEMRKRQPGLPVRMEGGPSNPLGARALYLGSTLYRIHGTNQAHTIGEAVSSGCIRMMNADVVDLYQRAQVGTPVYVYR